MSSWESLESCLCPSRNRLVPYARFFATRHSFESGLPSPEGAYLAYEVHAAMESVYALPFIPALLQTKEYAREVLPGESSLVTEMTSGRAGAGSRFMAA